MIGSISEIPNDEILKNFGFFDFPEDWDIKEIGELLSPDRGISVGVMYPGEHDPLGIPLVKVTDLKDNRINPKPDFRITKSKHTEYIRTEFQSGELLITLVGDVGKCAIVPHDMKGNNAARAVGVLRFQNQSDVPFIRWCLLTAPIHELMIAWSNTTVQTTLNLKEIKKIPIPWPPKNERDAIARILGSLDDKIELNRQMNETLEAMARAIFQSWFVDFDPVRAKAEGRQPAGMDAETAALFPSELVEVDGREVPKGWGVEPLDQIATFLNGLALQNYPPDGEDYLSVIKIAQMHKRDTEGSDRASINIPSEYIIDDGDVLFSWSGSLEVVIWCGGKGALNQHLFKVTSDKYPKWFYYLWVLHHLPDFQLIAEGKATTMGHIQRHHLSEAMVLVPSEKEIRLMNTMLKPLINKIIANNTESRTLAQIRDALLPKLMSGEIQIPDATIS